MSALTSKTQVCNLALAEIGAARISNLDTDTSAQAVACRLHFDHVRNSLLRAHPWNFATRAVALSASATAPVNSVEFDTAWALPGDMVRLIRIQGTDRDVPVSRFEIQGRYLHTRSLTTCVLVYVSNAVPVNEWDDLFVDALRYKLASEIAPDLAQSPQMADAALQKFKALALRDAQSIDAREVASGENRTPRQQAAGSGLVQARAAHATTVISVDSGAAALVYVPDLDAIVEEDLP